MTRILSRYFTTEADLVDKQIAVSDQNAKL